MSHKMLRPFIVKMSVLGYFPLIILYNLNYSIIIKIKIYNIMCSIIYLWGISM